MCFRITLLYRFTDMPHTYKTLQTDKFPQIEFDLATHRPHKADCSTRLAPHHVLNNKRKLTNIGDASPGCLTHLKE